MNSMTHHLSRTDEIRFTALMRGTYRKVFSMAFRLSGCRSDAEDLTQEAFYRAYRSFGDYEGDKPFENWIYRIVTRLFLDLLRARRRRVRSVSYDAPLPRESGEDSVTFDVPDASPGPESRLLDAQLSEPVERAMRELSPDQQMLIVLADIEGVPYREIAQMLGKPIGTIRSRLHRTHRLLRGHIERFREETKHPASSLNLCPTS